MNHANQCNKCKRADVRLYRSYGGIHYPDEVFCSIHIPQKERAIYVPLIEDDSGKVWGYTSVPRDAVKRWELLPDNDNVPFNDWK